MEFDFTSVLERKGWDALAVEGHGCDVREGFDIIPMWVADMNFPIAPAISEALMRRCGHPAFGYFEPKDAYFDAILQWHAKRYDRWDLQREQICYVNGVLGGVVAALKVFCAPGDKVLLQSPTYIGFTKSIEDNGWNIILNPLRKDDAGIWRIDYEDMEKKLQEHAIHAAVFCSPHNPSGRVWERWEIEKMMELYKKYDVYVVADEIWADLIPSKKSHIPTQAVSEDAAQRTVALYAPSKTFNLAGLVGAYQVICNPYLRDRVTRQERMTHLNGMNVLSMHALIAAYSDEGAAWIDTLREVLESNIDYAVAYIREHFCGVEVSKPEGTYMLFLNCEGWCQAHGATMDELLRAGQAVGVIWQDGRPFHGAWHIRMNLALPLSRVQEAFRRLDAYVFNKA